MGNQQSTAYGQVQFIEIIYHSSSSTINHPLLYDYQCSSQQPKKNIVIQQGATLGIHQNKFILLDQDYQKDQQCLKAAKKLNKILCKLKQLDNYYLLRPINNKEEQQIWVVLNSLPVKIFPIKKGYTLRFGENQVNVREILMHDEKFPVERLKKKVQFVAQYDNQLQQYQLQQKQKYLPTSSIICPPSTIKKNPLLSSITKKLCRVCNNSGIAQNPIFKPCLCKGSIAYIHLSCFRELYKKSYNIIQKNEYYAELDWNQLKCQLCGYNYKYSYSLGQNKDIIMGLFPRMGVPYVILEIVVDKQANIKKLLIISLKSKQTLTIGSSSQCQVILSYPSISQYQCQLTYSSQLKCFLIMDLSSKYGTLLKVKQKVRIRPHHKNIKIQIGNQLLQLRPQRKYSEYMITNYDQGNSIFEDKQNKQNNQDNDMMSQQEQMLIKKKKGKKDQCCFV